MTDSDSELLELAAKAAGISVWTDADETVFTDNPNGIEVEWNPLTDDGDALRLAICLSIDLQINQISVVALWGEVTCKELRSANNDRASTARRAIVRAAAEIGKGL